MKKGLLVLFIFLLAINTSCRKSLCYDHDAHSLGVRLDIKPTWDTLWQRDYGRNWEYNWNNNWDYSYYDLTPEIPSGLRSIVYYKDSTIYSENNLPPTGGRISLGTDKYSMLFYNNDTEYIVFDGVYNVASTRATTRTLSRSSYKSLNSEERTINQPDMLFSCYVDNYKGEYSLGAYEYNIKMKPLVYTYLIRYEFSRGLKHVALARGAMSGMAEFVYLNNGHTSSESATILYDCSIKSWGIEARVTTFGLPNQKGEHYVKSSQGSLKKNAMSLEVKLNNGTIKTFEFDITNQLINQPLGGVIIVSDLEITDKEGAGGGGFDVSVEGWGDAIDIPILM